MKLREEEFYYQYHQHGGTTIIPTEIFNELYDDATEEIERLNNDIKVLKFTIKTQQEQIQELIAREDKAIEYITTEQLYTNYQWGKSQYEKILKDLLDILKGSGKK